MPLMRLRRDGHLVPRFSSRDRDPDRAWRYTAAWSHASRTQIERAPHCQALGGCHRRITRRNPLTADHIIPVSRGGARYDPANLQTLCLHHNAVKGARVDAGRSRP